MYLVNTDDPGMCEIMQRKVSELVKINVRIQAINL